MSRRPLDPAVRFWPKVGKAAPDECWLWTGARTRDKYGTFWLGGRYLCAHRVAYELATGHPIPPGLEIDHLCRVTLCCNPAHLEAVTPEENVRRAHRIGYGANTTTCRRGHDWTVTPPIVRVRPDGGVKRRCRECVREWDRAYSARRRAVRAGAA